MTRGVVVLGSTGSIGTQALDVISRHPDDYRVVALAAGRNTELLAEQARGSASRPTSPVRALDAPDTLAELAAHPDADVVLNAVVGFAGLPATIAALEAGKRLALANKESLIAAGPVVAKARAAGGGEIVPVDSEHSAIWQCLRARAHDRGRAASSSPRAAGRSAAAPRAELADVNRADALAHPTWKMGAKITIDSLDADEQGPRGDRGARAVRRRLRPHRRRRAPAVDRARHGRVRRRRDDRAALEPDMRLPIGLALGAPDRLPEAFGAIDWTTLGTLTSSRPTATPSVPRPRLRGRPGRRHRAGDPQRRNEVAVEAFLAERIAWSAIAEIVEEVAERRHRERR